jgi:hypothetical protein
MDELVDVPQELKDAVRQRFKTGSAPKLAQKIKVGMAAAIHELRDHKSVSSLEYHPFEGAEPEEIDGIQSIYEFLKAKGLEWTLACLIQESAIDKDEGAIPLLDLLRKTPLVASADEEEEEEEEDIGK